MPNKTEATSFIALISTSWGSKNGGTNVFNTAIAKALSHVLREKEIQILCVVRDATPEELKDAENFGVNLIELDNAGKSQRLTANRAAEVIDIVTDQIDGEIIWWIGHDIFSGSLAAASAEKYGSKCAIFHHMNHEAYKAISKDENVQAKILEQKRTLEQADIVFAVGPKLANSAKDKLSAKRSIKVVKIIPGLEDASGVGMPNFFRAITFGRMTKDTDIIKQASLGAAAFGNCRMVGSDTLGNDASLTVLGISAKKEQLKIERDALLNIAYEHSKKSIPVNAFPYTEDREALLDELRTYSACMMLSVHEGFGLAGWEAIATEVPLVVSQNSGLFELLDELGGPAVGCVFPVEIRGADPVSNKTNPADIETVSQALRKIATYPEKAKANAKALKVLVNSLFTWEQAATHVAKELGIEADPIPMANVIATKWQPHRLLEALKKKDDVVDQAAKRRVLYRELWNAIGARDTTVTRVILFGGVASTLCDESAAIRYAEWLGRDSDASLLVCYETGAAAMARAATLGRDIISSDDLPSEPTIRMQMKSQRVEELPDLIIRNSARDNEDTIQNQVILLPIHTPLSTYVMVMGNVLSITPLFEQRSSETLTFALSSNSASWQADVLRYMMFHVKGGEESEAKSKSIREIENLATTLGLRI